MIDDTYQPEYDSLKELLIEITQERSVRVMLRRIVDHMAGRPHVALVRIWLLRTGTSCEKCPDGDRHLGEKTCLELSAEAYGNHPGIRRTHADKSMKCIPLASSDNALAAITGKGFWVNNIHEDPRWLKVNPWARQLEHVSIGARPILHKDELLGVIAVYNHIEIERVQGGPFWLKMIAHVAASAIANTRAFAEIKRLKAQLEIENEYLREEIKEVQAFGDIVGDSPQMLNILKQVALVAPTDATVLIQGESGTGKELIARAIHQSSERANKPLIRVNCATIPAELYESEFFGHVKGAFTGAVRDRVGRFQAADGGTIFLDEVGEISLNLQSKMLRVLQEGTFERIGEDITRAVDVRVIAATNRDLKSDVEAHFFREDLYYRLNVFPIEIVPLRQRKQDIPLLAKHFVKLICFKMNRAPARISQKSLREMIAYDWPGNVRELQNVVERAIIRSQSGKIHFDLPVAAASLQLENTQSSAEQNRSGRAVLTDAEMNQKVRENIITAMEECGGKIYGADGAAELLGIKPTTLCSRLKRMKIKKTWKLSC